MRRSHRALLALVAAAASLAACDGPRNLVVAETERQAHEVLVALADAGIDGAAVEPTTMQRRSAWQVQVPAARLTAARRVLVELGLPRPLHAGFDAMLADTGLIPNKTDERSRLMHAVAEELAETLEVHERILAARVHVVIPERELTIDRAPAESIRDDMVAICREVAEREPPEGEDDGAHQRFLDLKLRQLAELAAEVAERPTASVLLRYRSSGDNQDPPIAEADVRRLVAGAVERLDERDVTVIAARAAVRAPYDGAGAERTATTPLIDDDTVRIAFGVLAVLTVGLALWGTSTRRKLKRLEAR